jgi:hypothetical protein
MEITTLLAFLQLYAVAIVIGVGLLAVIVFLSTKNKILFMSLISAVALHIFIIIGVFVAGSMIKTPVLPTAPTPPMEITILPTPPIEKIKPVQPKTDPLDLPRKSTTSDKRHRQIETTKEKSQPESSKRHLTINDPFDKSPFPTDYDDPISASQHDNLTPTDIDPNIPIGTVNNNNDDVDEDGGNPYCINGGTSNGKVYFITLKWGGANSGWCANSDGLNKLLNFVNQTVPCQKNIWPMAASEIRKKYLMKNMVPSFVYIYCDETFSLNNVDVTVLRDYINKGGFLFMDSRDESIKDKVSRELEKVLPGKFAPIRNDNPINSFLFRLNQPGVGLNPGAKNYGIIRNGRIMVFYTPGNFSYVYANYKSNEDDYFKAQYQMGTNVIMYAIRKGDSNGLEKVEGAKTTLTKTVIDKITGGDAPVQPNVTVKEKSVKLKNESTGNSGYGAFTEPEEIGIE